MKGGFRFLTRESEGFRIHCLTMSKRQSALHCYAVLTVTATWILLIAGSLVTSTDSGLAVPDWPLSYGMLFPPMVGGIFYEHGHRMIAGAVALMILALAIWLGKREPRRWMRRLGYAALAMVLLQALLGGGTVLFLLPSAISIAHACLGQAVFCLTVGIAWGASAAHSAQAEAIPELANSPLKGLAIAVALLAALQLLLGAILRHTGSALGAHLIGAASLFGAAIGLCARAWRLKPCAGSLWSFSRRLMMLVAVQGALGGFVFLHRGSVALRSAHVAVGALVLAQAVILAWEAWRRTPAAEARPLTSAPSWPGSADEALSQLNS